MSTAPRSDLPFLRLQNQYSEFAEDLELYKDGTLARYYRFGPLRSTPLQQLVVPSRGSTQARREVVYLPTNKLNTIVSYLSSKGLFSATHLFPGDRTLIVAHTLVLRANLEGKKVTRVIVGDIPAKIGFIRKITRLLGEEFPPPATAAVGDEAVPNAFPHLLFLSRTVLH
jgi:hypothetical protein